MFRNAVYALFAGSLIGGVVGQSQIVFDSIHNFTSITGTWTSGSRAVSTGKGFVDPQNKTFTYPKNTGISYSFTDDGFYEIARYRFNSNGSEPNCITGVVNWAHGTYDLLSNGSIVMTPFGDGFQQIQDPCAAVSNFIEDYNLTELYQSWRIFNDINDGPKLHLFQFNGAPLAPQFRLSQTPIMMPTKPLRNVTKPVAGSGQAGSGFNGQVALAQQQGGAEKVVVAGLTAGLVGLVGLLAAVV